MGHHLRQFRGADIEGASILIPSLIYENSYPCVQEGKTLFALWGPTMFFTKLSLLLLFYRIFSPDRVTKYLVMFGILWIFVLYTTFLLLIFLLCQSALLQSCASEWTLFVLTTSGLNILNDIYLLIIPLAAIARLQMPSRQKLGVSAIFLTGLLSVYLYPSSPLH